MGYGVTSENHHDLLAKVAARGRDLLTLVAVGGFFLGLLLVLSDNLAVREKLSEMVGVAQIKNSQQEIIFKLNTLTERYEDYLKNTAERSANAEEQRIEILERLEALELNKMDKSPAIRFLNSGNDITDGRPGDIVAVTQTFLKLRDCGRPTVDTLLSDSDGTIFRFEDVSILDETGRGVATPADPNQPQTIRYTARIPDSRGVTSGAALGWVVLANYETCPWLSPVESPKMSFTIRSR